MMMWDLWKKGFDAWESTTAQYFEHFLKSPTMLEPAGAMLTGGQVNAVNGVATFNNLVIDLPGAGYQLDANAAGLTDATSNAFTITEAPRADELVFTVSSRQESTITVADQNVTNIFIHFTVITFKVFI